MTSKTSSSTPGRSRGRPRIGPPVTTRLAPEDLQVALALGDGIDAVGLRKAVQIAGFLGPSMSKEILEKISQGAKNHSDWISSAESADVSNTALITMNIENSHGT